MSVICKSIHHSIHCQLPAIYFLRANLWIINQIPNKPTHIDYERDVGVTPRLYRDPKLRICLLNFCIFP